MMSAQTQQGYTYQNLQECGLSYVTSDANLMSDIYLASKGIDKQKVLERQQQNKKLTINESSMIPYLVMGIKAIEQNRQESDSRMESINEKLEITNQAVEQSLQLIEGKMQNFKNELIAMDELQKNLYLSTNSLIENNTAIITKNNQQDNIQNSLLAKMNVLATKYDSLNASIVDMQSSMNKILIKLGLMS